MLPRGAVEGTLVADPELRFATSGTAVCSMRIVSTDRKFNRDTNEWEDGDQLWLDVTCFKLLAEHTVESLVKGDRVIITGKWKTDEWSDRETGAKRSKITFVADAVAPSLATATVKISKTTRNSGDRQAGGSTPASSHTADPWASPQTDEPPF